MRFLAMVRSNPSAMGIPPQALMDAMRKLVQEGFESGTLIETGGLSFAGARIRVRQGKITVTDGPYAESKEIVGGYAVMDYPTQEEAVAASVRFMELHRDLWPGWEGESEVRPMERVPAPA